MPSCLVIVYLPKIHPPDVKSHAPSAFYKPGSFFAFLRQLFLNSVHDKKYSVSFRTIVTTAWMQEVEQRRSSCREILSHCC
jgi:hypothetical protein